MAPRPATLVRSIATVGSLTLVSRLLGFVRDILIAGLLGAGPLADAFFVAFKLPNFLRRLFAEGAFNAGFVPMFARTLEGEGRAAAKAFAEQAQAIQLAVLAHLVLLTIVVGCVILVQLHGRIEGWKLALGVLAAYVLYSVVR